MQYSMKRLRHHETVRRTRQIVIDIRQKMLYWLPTKYSRMDVRKRGAKPPLPRSRKGSESPFALSAEKPLGMIFTENRLGRRASRQPWAGIPIHLNLAGGGHAHQFSHLLFVTSRPVPSFQIPCLKHLIIALRAKRTQPFVAANLS